MDTGKTAGHLAVAGAYTIFGLNIVFCKDIANSDVLSPYVLFTLRAAGATALFWLISLFMPSEKVERGDFWKIAAASSIGLFLTQISFLIAITMATSIDTAIMGTLGPIFTMFFAFLFLGEPITGKKAGGVALSFAGVLYLIYNSVHSGGADHSTPLGIVLLLVNSLSFSLYLGLFRPLISKYNVVTFMKWMFLFSLLLSLPLSFRGFLETDFAAVPARVGWEVGYLVFFATFVARTETPAPDPGQHVLLPPAHPRHRRQHLDRPRHPHLAETPRHHPHRRRRHPRQPLPRPQLAPAPICLLNGLYVLPVSDYRSRLENAE